MENPIILIVEDHLITQDLTRLFFERHGFETACANNGTAALGWVQQHRFKLILVDIGLPDYDGFALITLLKQYLPQARFIAITAQYDAEMLSTAQQVGCVALLEKPMTELTQIEGIPIVDYLSKLND